MITLPIGLVIVAIVMYFATHGVELSHFLNFHSFVIVIVGTAAAVALSAPLETISGLIKATLKMGKSITPKKTITDTLYALVENRNTPVDVKIHPLINMAKDMWEQGIEQELFEELMEQRLEDMKAKSEEPVSLLRNLAKYPPALGMMGTVMGMVSLFANLNSDNKGNIGADLALAMTATFYGLLLANLFITPLSDRLFVQHLYEMKINEMVFNTLLFINRNEPLSVIENIDEENATNAA